MPLISCASRCFCGSVSGASLAQRCIAAQAGCGDCGHEVSPAITLSQRFHAVFPSHEIAAGWNSSIATCNASRDTGDVRTTATKTQQASTKGSVRARREVKLKRYAAPRL